MSTSEEAPRPRRRRIAGERSRSPGRGPEDKPSSPPAPAPPAPVRPRPSPPPPSGATAGAPEQPARPRWALWFPALVAVTVIATVLAAVFGYQASRADEAPAAAAAPAKDAVASAVDATGALLSFRFDTLPQELEAESSLMTPAYSQRFGSTFSAQARARLTEQQVNISTRVLAAAQVECGEDCPSDRAQVLVFFDKVTTKGGGEPDYSPNRAIVSMQLDDGAWLVDDIRTV